MATEKKYQKMNSDSVNLSENKSNTKLESQIFTELTCDICGSTDIIETKEGYVCRTCGLVLEIQKLKYNRPYNRDIIQYAALGTTQIGSILERIQNVNSVGLIKLNKLQSIKSNKEIVLEKAKIEISRIFSSLGLPEAFKDIVFKKFKKIRSALKPGTKYRSPDKLVPLSIYFCLKFQNISIIEAELLEVSKISKKDFNAFKLQIYIFFPQYKERNRKEYILQKILEISEDLHLGMVFYYQSKKLLYKLWESIKNTKDDVIAGLVASISVLCGFKEKVSVSSICDKLGIKMSTIQSQVKKRIFERFQISGFVSLVKSSEILKKIIEKMGIIKKEKFLVNIDNESSEIIHNIVSVNLGNVIQVFNHYNNIDYYFYVLKDNNGYPLLVSLKLYNPSITFENQHIGNSINRNDLNNWEDKLLEIEFLKFNAGKDPPLF
jgi:transcription initiation factor TFIIIB Brf1 subunit/transcription initiation factor TFIIB